ncbi:MAG: DUF2783 domain-containing protein [Rhodocyclaceae bacterium]|nr:DUF2783 domain-containing protein [Rhodocyclaceae bacterium]MBX3670487.1 DUF2783 domain-containing protein [Rhodocyclaceae bacterium]
MPLILDPNFHDPNRKAQHDYDCGDEFFEMLCEAHRDLSDEQAAAFDARLILVLANHVGDLSLLREAMRVASEAAR